MRILSLAFLFGIVSSLMFSADLAAFAQESEQHIDESMMLNESVEHDMAEDQMEDTMEDTMTEVPVLSPLMQLTMGVDPHDIECMDGQMLVFRATNWQPACINESSFETLSARGWAADHDPSHSDLEKMVAEHMSKHPAEEPKEIDIGEGIDIDGNAGVNGTDAEPEPEPQSFTINLREDMEMGAN